MATNSEKGHAKNVGLFQELITNVRSYGSVYRPANLKLELTALENTYGSAEEALRLVAQAKVVDDAAITTRQDAFAPIKKLATRIINSLASCGASDGTVEHARAYNRKLQSSKTPKKKESEEAAEEEAPAKRSDSQRSYDNQIQHFSNIVDTVALETKYNPQEAGLKVAALRAVITTLKNANKAAIETDIALTKARNLRDTVLYHPQNGLVPIALDSKAYILSLFGKSSNEYKAVGKLKFVIPGKVKFAVDVPEPVPAA